MLIFQSVKNLDDHQLNIAENSMISANSKSLSVKYLHDENVLMIDQKIRAIISQGGSRLPLYDTHKSFNITFLRF